ncbi:hypothetical protein CC80DRAFT_98027 [Byssothecium circinans]|uniref:Transmembrane protein n=1 Tax=Byssothecium circinans TaxID=147558 RepID=A0A6A5UGC1_9PLEO|nr:hypothetical protein CC80DRAFT_98027 [Byssothecium circinans]
MISPKDAIMPKKKKKLSKTKKTCFVSKTITGLGFLAPPFPSLLPALLKRRFTTPSIQLHLLCSDIPSLRRHVQPSAPPRVVLLITPSCFSLVVAFELHAVLCICK